MSLPKHDLRIYLDADTKAELDAYAEALCLAAAIVNRDDDWPE